MCRGLAWLLDPEGGHHMGRHLDALLRRLDLPTDDTARLSADYWAVMTWRDIAQLAMRWV